MAFLPDINRLPVTNMVLSVRVSKLLKVHLWLGLLLFRMAAKLLFKRVTFKMEDA